MAICSYCGIQEMMPFRCKFCSQAFCADHRLPENHSCMGLKEFKTTRVKAPETWIYEPFREDRKKAPAGRVMTKPSLERLKDYFRTLDSKKILDLILIFIVISLLLSAIR